MPTPKKEPKLLSETCDREWFPDLTADREFCEAHLHSEKSGFWRRAYIRATFTILEARNETLREKALEAVCSADKTEWSITRMELLGDTTYRILKNGTLQADDLRAPFINYTAFILRALAEESGVEVTFFSDHGWNCFQQAVAIRNRLTHPRGFEDIQVSDEDLEIIERAIHWHFESARIAFSNPEFWNFPEPF